jgi:tetratricopeptide (TPR) repeat protein
LGETEVAIPPVASETPSPAANKPGSTADVPAVATSRPETRVQEKTLSGTGPENRGESALRDSEKDRGLREPEPSSARIQSTGNPEAATWEQRSYNAAVQGDFEQAIASASKAIELDPSRVNPYINRAWAYLEKNMLEAAISDCKTALSIDPQNAFAYNNRGLVYQRKGKMSLAEKDYTRACDLGLELGCQNLDELTKQSRVAQLIDQSQGAFNSKDWDRVIRITTEVLDLDPQNAVAYTNRSAAYAQKDFLNKALKDSNDAIKFNPDFSLAYNNRGYVLELLGNKRQASVDYLKSCSLGLDLGCKNYERLSKAQ